MPSLGRARTPPDQLAAAHKQHLGHGVQPILRQGDDILLGLVGALGVLLLHQPVDVADAVAQFGRALKLHGAGSRGHALL